jgi:hypothetical protein
MRIFCAKLITDESLHYLQATDVREDDYGDMEVLNGDEVVAWYWQPLVEYWSYDESETFLNPRWREACPTMGEQIQAMCSGQALIGADESGSLWYDITPNRS